MISKYLRSLIDRYKRNKKTFILFTILHIMVILTAIRCLVTHNYESFATCLLVLLLFLLPALIEDRLKLTIPPLFQAIIFAFIFAAEILGEVDHYYTKIPGWDTILHTLNGFLFAAVGFSTIYLLNRGSKDFKLSPMYLAMVAFCFSMTIGVIWEFFECAMDLFLNKDMQKDFIVQTVNSVTLDPDNSGDLIHVNDITETVIHTASGETTVIKGGYLDIGILDTMKDLLVNLIGAVVFSTFGFIALKTSKSNKVVENLMIRPDDGDEEPDEVEETEEDEEAEEAEPDDEPDDE
ncbi:MAG: hypothetical protein IJI20_04715 [Firmicutes bacterium]|nr:hypothetical protein [Bacillota bacterium]